MFKMEVLSPENVKLGRVLCLRSQEVPYFRKFAYKIFFNYRMKILHPCMTKIKINTIHNIININKSENSMLKNIVQANISDFRMKKKINFRTIYFIIHKTKIPLEVIKMYLHNLISNSNFFKKGTLSKLEIVVLFSNCLIK